MCRGSYNRITLEQGAHCVSYFVLFRVEKEFEIKKNSLNSQKEKIEETHKREIEKCTARKSDLNQQLEDMQQKLKVGNVHIVHCIIEHFFIFVDAIL